MVGYARNGTPAFRAEDEVCGEIRIQSPARYDIFYVVFSAASASGYRIWFFPVFAVRTFYPLYFLPLFFSGILVVYFIRESCHHPHPTIALGKNLTGGDDRVACKSFELSKRKIK